MDRSRSSFWRTAVAALLASLLVHLLLWPAADRVLRHRWTSLPVPAGGVMEVALLPAEGPSRPRPEPPEEPPPPEEEPRHPDGKVVRLDAVEDPRPPEAADYLSEFDSRTQRPRRAPVGRPVAPPAGAAGRGDAPGTAASFPGPAKATRPIPLRPSRAAPRSPAGGASVAADVRPDGAFADREGESPAAEGGALGLLGSPDLLRRSVGAPGTYDDLRELEEGDATILNSRRWKYASFFNRVRDMVAQQWDPAPVHRARDPDGSVYGSRTRVTVLGLSLTPDGALARVRLLSPSGADHLDEEAIRAVRAAAPFPNPPAGLVDPATRRIEFTFGFVFEIGGRQRIFRLRR